MTSTGTEDDETSGSGAGGTDHVGTERPDGYYVDRHGDRRTTTLSQSPTLHEPVYVEDSTLGRWTEIRRDSRVSHSTLGDYSYLM